MKPIIFLLLLSAITSLSFAQNEQQSDLKLSLQTNTLAYTSAGGYSIWGTANYKRLDVGLSYVNYPNRRFIYYNNTGLKENDRFVRLRVGRYFNPEKKFKNLIRALHFEYHWRELEEDGTSEVLSDTHFMIGSIWSYQWQPFEKKENALANFSILFWTGPNFYINHGRLGRTFQETGSVYEVKRIFIPSLGVNLSYTFWEK